MTLPMLSHCQVIACHMAQKVIDSSNINFKHVKCWGKKWLPIICRKTSGIQKVHLGRDDSLLIRGLGKS